MQSSSGGSIRDVRRPVTKSAVWSTTDPLRRRLRASDNADAVTESRRRLTATADGRIRRLVGIWLTSALVLGTLLAVSTAGTGPLDDPDLAKQRAGMLDVVGERSIAPQVSPWRPAAGRSRVVFFVRPAQFTDLRLALDAGDGRRLIAAADLAVVVSAVPAGAPDALMGGRTPVVSDRGGQLARSYRMRLPRDGGPPVGYAIVGPDGTVRFRTEDPEVAGRIDEVLTMLKAVR